MRVPEFQKGIQNTDRGQFVIDAAGGHGMCTVSKDGVESLHGDETLANNWRRPTE